MRSLKATILLLLLALLACFVANRSSAASWTLSVSEQNGLASLSTGFKVEAPFEYSIVADNQLLNLRLVDRVKKSSDRRMTWEYDLNERSALSDVIGGGISLRFDVETEGLKLYTSNQIAEKRGDASRRDPRSTAAID
jgi:hypothetical protein